MTKKQKKPAAKVAASEAHRLVALVRKKFGEHAALTVSDEARALAEIKGYCSTGLDVLDHYVIGRGGFPEGRISEVYGDEGACKTSLAYSCMAAVQRAGGVACFFDVEGSFDRERAQLFGVNLEQLVMFDEVEHLEQLFEIVKFTVDNHHGKTPLLLVWDSIAGTCTKDGYMLEAGESRVGDVARIMSAELRKLPSRLHKKRAHLMMINQTRATIGMSFGPNVTTPGGKAPKFYSSVRLWIVGGAAKKNAFGEHVSKDVTIMAAKNRLATPWRKAVVRFNYTRGWDNEWSTIEHAVTVEALKGRGEGGKKPAGRKMYEEACKRLGWTPREIVALNQTHQAEDVVADVKDAFDDIMIEE